VREDFGEDDVDVGVGDSALLAGTVHASYRCRGAAGDRSAGDGTTTLNYNIQQGRIYISVITN
jgi:hypothetical protein